MNRTADSMTAADEPVTRGELAELFLDAEVPKERWRIGGEAEKFGVDAATGAAVGYEGDRGIKRVFAALINAHRWRPETEMVGGPVVALRREQASITLEPGAQLELSGSPVQTVHDICAEMRAHMDELGDISADLNLVWLGVGFHPIARQDELPWVPKQRYRVMKRFLPTRGSRALDMMRRTATVQANFDYASEADAMGKLGVALRMSPILTAMFANSPFIEGRIGDKKSERGDVWLHMDPARSGLIPALWARPNPTYDDYIEWALDAPMFLFRRGDAFIKNTGQTFRSFLDEGYDGYRATRADWASHINSLFPEARLKTTIEVRACDSLPQDLACAAPALLTGILYDDRALDEARRLLEPFSYETVEAARPRIVRVGLAGRIGTEPVQRLAERLIEIAEGGLERRAQLSPGGKDERLHLERLKDLVEGGRSPADRLMDGLSNDDPNLKDELIARSAVSGWLGGSPRAPSEPS